MTTVIEISFNLKNHLFAYGKRDFELSMSPTMCRLRWQWLVDSWDRFLPRFRTIATTDELRKRLSQLGTALIGANIFDALGLQAIWYYWPFLQSITLADLQPLTEDEERELALLKQAKLSLYQLQDIQLWLQNEASKATWTIGAGDELTAAALSLPIARQLQSATVAAYSQILSTYDLISFIDGLIYDEKIRMQDSLTPFPGGLYKSFYTVPFEISIEHMAQKYGVPLEDILTANNLQPPFFSTGTKVPCTVAGGLAIIAKRPIYLGDLVTLGSAADRESRFSITDIIDTGDGMLSLVLPSILARRDYKAYNYPYLRVFPPHCLNLSSQVRIPSTVDVGRLPAWQAHAIQQMNAALLMFGNDIEMQDSDIVVSSDKGLSIVYGMQYVEQVVRHIIQTQAGELPMHPEVGIKPLIGEMVLTEEQENAAVAKAVEQAVLRDPRFADCQCIVLSSNPFKLQVRVKVKGTDSFVPFEL